MIADLPQLDIEKSINKQRLVYKKTGSYIFDTIITYTYLLIFIGMAVYGLIFYYNVAFTVTLSALFLVWITADLITVNKLIKVNRHTQNLNNEKILKVLHGYEPDFEVVSNTSQIIQIIAPGMFSWGNVWTIIVTEDYVYLNLSSLARWDMISPFHAIYNYILSRRLATLLKT